jgi:hypothetical protein
VADFLAPVIQEFIARTAAYVDPVLAATEVVGRFRDANIEAARAIQEMSTAAARSAGAESVMAQGAAAAVVAVRTLADSEDRLRDAMYDKTAAALIQGERLRDLQRTFTDTAMAARVLTAAESDLTARAAIAAMTTEGQVRAELDLRDTYIGAAFAAHLLTQAQADLSYQTRVLSIEVLGQGRSLDVLQGQLAITAGTAGILQRAEDDLKDALGEKTGAAGIQKATLDSLRDTMGTTAIAAAALGTAEGGLAGKTQRAGGEATHASRPFHGFLGWLVRLSFAAHVFITSVIEITATAIPALIALADAFIGMAPTFVKIFEHERNLVAALGGINAASTKTGQKLLDLTGRFHQVVLAMAPDAYSIFGSILNDLSEHVGHFAQTAEAAGNVLARFAAEVTVDLSPSSSASSSTHGFFAHSIQDMVAWGQVLSSIGHIFKSFVGDMPGAAEIFLQFLDVILKFIGAVVASPIAGFFIKWGLALHEVYLWSKLLMLVVNGLAGLIVKLAARLVALVLDLGLTGAAADAATEGVGALEAASATLASVPLFAWMAGVALALGAVYLAFHPAQDSAEKFADSLEKAAQSAKNMNVVNVLVGNIDQLNQATNAATKTASNFSGDWRNNGVVAMEQASKKAQELSGSLHQQNSQLQNVAVGAAYLMKTYGVSYPEALGLADAANVKLLNGITGSSKAARVARQEFANLVLGLKQMNVPAGAIGADLQVMNYNAMLASSEIGKVNQAWDQFITNSQSAENAFVTFAEGVIQLQSGLGSTTAYLTGSFTKLTAGLKLTGASMSGVNSSSLQLQQQFEQSAGDIEPMIDAMRLAHVGSGALKTAIVDMITPLYKLGETNKGSAAQLMDFAREAGIHTPKELAKLVDSTGSTHDAMESLKKITDGTTVSLSDLAQMASQLDNDLQAQLISSLDQTTLKAVGFNGQLALASYEAKHFSENSPEFHATLHTMYLDLLKAGDTAKQAAAFILLVSEHLAGLHSTKVTVGVNYDYTSSGYVGRNVSAPPPPPIHIKKYDSGGWLPQGWSLALNQTGAPERVGGGGGSNGPSVVVHVHGSVVATQDVARAVQTALNQKTIRNGSTQAYIKGRLH